MKVEFTVPALLELEGIAEWIAQDNPARAYNSSKNSKERASTSAVGQKLTHTLSAVVREVCVDGSTVTT